MIRGAVNSCYGLKEPEPAEAGLGRLAGSDEGADGRTKPVIVQRHRFASAFSLFQCGISFPLHNSVAGIE